MEFSAEMLKRRLASGLRQAAEIKGTSADHRSPSPETVDDVLGIQDDREFLQRAYLQILGRPCDVYGMVTHLGALANHVPRRTILQRIADSEEAKGRRSTARSTDPPRRPLFARLYSRILGLFGNLLRRIVLVRFDSIDHKLVFLIQEIATRTENLSQKSDDALWTLSEKLDANFSEGRRNQEALRAQVLRQSAEMVELRARVDHLSKALAAMESEFQLRYLSGLQTQLGELTAKFDAGDRSQADRWSAQSALTERIRQDVLNSLAYLQRIEDEAFQRQTETLIQHHVTASDQAQAQAAELLRLELDRAIGGILTPLGQQQELVSQIGQGLSTQMEDATHRLYPPVFQGDGDLLVTQVEGFIVAVPKQEWRIASHFAFRGVLEPGLTNLFQQVVKPGMVIVDVGANIGIYTLLSARLLAARGKVHSFEPTPQTASILRQNVQVNGFLESGTIDLHAEAVTDQIGVGRLTIFANNCGHNTLFGDSAESDSVTVPTISLDEALQAEDHVDFVKIDAEGAEATIIRGMRETILRNPSIRIVLEFAPTHLKRANVDPAEFLSELQALGFTVTRVNDLSGELEAVSDEELLHAFSVNIHLARSVIPKGATL